MRPDHIQWVTDNLPAFFRSVDPLSAPCELDDHRINDLGTACYKVKFIWKKERVPFLHGVLIYILAHTPQYKEEVKASGNPCYVWVIDNYQRFKSHIPS